MKNITFENKLINPKVFRDLEFRGWIQPCFFLKRGVYLDTFNEMNSWQRYIFIVFGYLPKKFRPKFEFYLEKAP